jgi:hypothetical protein
VEGSTPLDDEGRRLLAIFEALRDEEMAAAKLISSPRRSMLYPEHLKMVEGLADLQSRRSAAGAAFRAYCQRK